MAEDMGDKTEAATPRRRQEAREQGNIARSQDLTAAVLLLSFVFLLDWYGPGLILAMRLLMEEMLSLSSLSDLDGDNVAGTLLRALVLVGTPMLPLLVGIVIVAVLVNILQVGFFISGKRLQPNLNKLNPANGISRMFKGGRGFVQLLMNVAKLGLVGYVAYSAVSSRMAEIVTIQQLTFIQIFGLGTGIIYSVALRIGVVLLVLAIIDYVYQRFRHEKDLRMSKQEVKEEMKRMDGDPHVKARLRQVARQMLMQKIQKDVPTADVVVTNPTEIAVALRYEPGMTAPKVIAKGRGHIAQRIREVAIASGVPIIERKPLARALFRLVEVGQEIPEQFYSTVAEILAYVYELSGKAKRRRVAV